MNSCIGVGKVSKFSLFHGNVKQKKLNTAKIADSFMRKVSKSYIDNMKTKDNLKNEDVNLEFEIVNEVSADYDHEEETEEVSVVEEASNDTDCSNNDIVTDRDRQNDFDNMAETYGDNMEFFDVESTYNEPVQDFIEEREFLITDLENSFTMSTYDSELLIESEENTIDKAIHQPKNDDSRELDENEIYVIYVKEENQGPEKDPLEEHKTDTIRMTPVHRRETIRDSNFLSPDSYFDSFEHEAFSSPRQRIAKHFNQLIQRPWQTNYAW